MPLVVGGKNFTSVTDNIAGVAEKPTPLGWYIAFVIALSLLGLLGLCVNYLILTGVGVWGNNQPVGWGFGIVNFVFWVGIGHAGTLISAILFLFRQNWRTGINRFAEAMTIFAVICAGMFPGIHVGRAWMAYYMFPISQSDADVAATSAPRCCGTCLPSAPMRRFRCSSGTSGWCRIWRRSAIAPRQNPPHRLRHFRAGVERLEPPLASLRADVSAACRPRDARWCLSVHSVVSFDFATAQLPGWHATIFPPYFVAGAIFGGFAMVLCLAIPCREFFGLKDIITKRHLDNMGKILLATGMIVGYSYLCEAFIAWYGGNATEQFTFKNRAFGPYAWAYWTMMWCNVMAPQFLWSSKLRKNLLVLFIDRDRLRTSGCGSSDSSSSSPR